MIRDKSKILLFALCLVNIFMVFKIFDEESGIPAYKDLRLKIEGVQATIDDIDAQNRQLSSEIRVLKRDEKYVQRLIKRELCYVADNEIMYIVK
ncbi:Septum formation initiator [anaerobic digester metagenome]